MRIYRRSRRKWISCTMISRASSPGKRPERRRRRRRRPSQPPKPRSPLSPRSLCNLCNLCDHRDNSQEGHAYWWPIWCRRRRSCWFRWWLNVWSFLKNGEEKHLFTTSIRRSPRCKCKHVIGGRIEVREHGETACSQGENQCFLKWYPKSKDAAENAQTERAYQMGKT